MDYAVGSVPMGDFYPWSHWKMNEFRGAFFDKVDKSGPILPMTPVFGNSCRSSKNQ